MVQNKGLIFAEVPNGLPKPGKDLKIEDRPINIDTVEIPKDGLLVKNHYVSFGEPIGNSAISSVIRSNNSRFHAGDVVTCYMSGFTEEYSVLSAEIVENTVSKPDNPHGIDYRHWLSSLGMPGLTAYASFFDIGEPKKGETIFISSASGAVGALVGQLAKRQGLKVIGSVGDDKKLEYILKDLGFDGGFNYKKEDPKDALARLATNGLDIYFENVGGAQLEAALGAMNNYGRIVACGMVSEYNKKPEEQYGVRGLMSMVAKRLKFQGFIINDYLGPKYKEEHQKTVQSWLHEGSLKANLSETKGIDNAAEGFVGMLEGKNFGKALLVIDPLEK